MNFICFPQIIHSCPHTKLQEAEVWSGYSPLHLLSAFIYFFLFFTFISLYLMPNQSLCPLLLSYFSSSLVPKFLLVIASAAFNFHSRCIKLSSRHLFPATIRNLPMIWGDGSFLHDFFFFYLLIDVTENIYRTLGSVPKRVTRDFLGSQVRKGNSHQMGQHVCLWRKAEKFCSAQMWAMCPTGSVWDFLERVSMDWKARIV